MIGLKFVKCLIEIYMKYIQSHKALLCSESNQKLKVKLQQAESKLKTRQYKVGMQNSGFRV